ncbi:hemagglutinin repeat-containing protein [Rodentibacter abscessus]|uniref:two-partner secretion domain-containing protein n=1 Tax=Rodentibacter abscessus TaxID=3381777 RepID=UPI00399CBD99
MNKQCFRVIFSKTLQRLVVTSELAKSADKSNSGEKHQSAVGFESILATLKPLSFSLFCVLGFVMFSSQAVADTLIIKADPNAPKNQQPIVLQTANGLPQVNIQTPNNKGLSHNKYHDFNVDKQGAILNNSRKNVSTQQAGMVQGNPYLARGEAKVILNEVTSGNPSQLKGYLEVAGKKAEVIIANPNGLYCNGCGTINATRSTMTTGKPQIKDGQIESFRIERGKVKVSGKGLDNSRIDYTDILAREAEINAGLWAGKKLNVVTGKNEIKQAGLENADNDLQIIRTSNEKLAENQPHFALDVSELGGMYAGKIHLIGTEQGLGVRNAGHIGASAETLMIDSQGKIVNSGTVNAQQQITLKTPKEIENNGRIEAKTQHIKLQSNANIKQNGSVIAQRGGVSAKAKNTISQRGETVAKGKISYKANDINATPYALIAAGVTTTQSANGETRQLDSQSAQGSNIDIQAENKVQLAGRHIASGQLNINAQSVNLGKSQNNAYDIAVIAKLGDVQADESQLSAVENLTISTPKTLSTQNSQLVANRIQTSQQNLHTPNALWQQSGTGDFSLNARYIQNQAGTFSTGGNFNVNADDIDNTSGRLIAGQNLTIKVSDKLNSAQGTLFANNSLSLQANQLMNTNGLIKSLGNMSLSTRDISNQQTNTSDNTQKGIIALGHLAINSATVDNTLGFIGSNQNLAINADKLLNDSGKVYSTQQAELRLNNGYYSRGGQLQAGSLSITTPIIEQHQGNITVNHQLEIIGDSLVSANHSDISANDINMRLAKSLTQSESAILGNHSVVIDVKGGLDNINSTVASRHNDLVINTNNATLNNTKGTLFAKQNFRLNSGNLNNDEGIVQSKSNATLRIGELSNKDGVIMANNAEVISAGINNEKGTVFTHTTLNIVSNALNNAKGSIISQGELNANTQGAALNNLQGQIFANAVKLNTGAINNQQGLLRGDKTLAIDTNNQQLNNQQTQEENQGIVGLGSVVLNNISQLNNTQGRIATAENLAINTRTLTNTKGIVNAQAQTTIHADQIDNQKGSIWGANTHLNAATINNRKEGQNGSLIGANDTLNITAIQLNNQQTVATGDKSNQGLQAKNIQLNTAELNNQQGGIYATNTLSAIIENQFNNQAGEFLAGQTAKIHSRANHLVADNQDGTIEAGQQLNLKAKTLQNEGTIKTQGNAEIVLTDNFTLNQAFQVGNNLTFSTLGDFVNNVKQIVGNQASFSAANLINHQNAEISANRTLINTGTITNYGLLDGTENIIKTGTLNNLGSGRIYGNHLAIQAEKLNNLNQGEKSATIAARERLDLGVGTLINRDHSLIFSIGDIAIGGQLNDQNQAIGYAKFVDNGSATIEALGNGEVKTERLLNHDLHLKLGEHHTDEHIIEYAPSKNSKRYALLNKDGGEGRFELKNNDKHDSNSYFILKDGTRIASRYWTTWDYNRHTKTSTIEHRDPAKILIGGTLSLSGSDLENNASTLFVGKALLLGDSIFTKNENNGNLTAGGITLKNIDILGDIDVTDTGKWNSFGKERKRYGVRGKKRWAVYGKGRGDFSEIHPTAHFTFNKVLNEIGNDVIGTNTEIDSKSNSTKVELKTIATSSLSASIEKGNIVTPASAVISGQVSASYPEKLGDNRLPVIKTHLAEITLPKAGLYQINPDAPNGYLVETDSKFTDRKKWLSSDYMFNALRYDHNNVQKRLGDGFYEQRLINEQINRLTGRRFLDNYSSDFEQYKALMNNGVYYAKKFNLTPGVGLTAAQMAELTSDMVWLVNKEITLPSGKTLTVLTPQVYLVSRNLDVTTQGALISAREISGNIKGNITNSGTIAGRNLTALSAEHLNNQGIVLGSSVNLLAKQKLVNLGGKIQALDSAVLMGNQGVEIASQTSSSANYDAFGNQFAHTNLNRQAEIDVKGALQIFSPKDVTLKAANLNADVIHIQGDKVDIGTVSTSNKQHYNANSDNYSRLDQQQEIGSELNAANHISILSQNATRVRQAALHSNNGTIAITSINGDIQIQEGRNKEQLAFGAKSTHSGTLQKTTITTKHDHRYDVAEGSAIDGNRILLRADKGNVTVQGSSVVGEKGFSAIAQNIAIQEAENRIFEQDFEKTSKSGLMGSGGFGFSVGMRKESVENDQTKYYAQKSQVGSLNGDTTLIADKQYRQSASHVTSVKGDVSIQAEQADIAAASDKYETNYKRTFEQKGLTIAINTPIQAAINAVKQVADSVQTVGESKDNRINAMAAANAGWTAYRAGQTLGQVGKSLGELMQNGTVPTEAVSVSITYGEQKSEETRHTEGSTANNSQVNAGGKVMIQASGAGKQSNINIIGSDVGGKQGTALIADNDVNLTAQQQTHKERSRNKSSGFNAGVALAVGKGVSFGITAGGNYGRGYGNGDDETYRNSHIGDSSSQTLIQAGNNATIKGAQVQGKGVTLNAENLHIESLQDKMKYQGKQMNVSGQVTVGYGFAMGSGGYGNSKVNSDYASVKAQAGIFAGDEGYQINVGNHVNLIGGAILSDAEASKNKLSARMFSFKEIENHANTQASAVGLAAGFSVGRDQTSEEDKEKNNTYRKQREEKGETFEQANPNKANRSPIGFGLGENDVHSADFYALAKIGLTNLLGNTKKAENTSSTTLSVISEGQFDIKDPQGQENIKQITKGTNTQTNSLQKQDYRALQKEVETDLAIKKSFHSTVADLTDEAYRTMFISEHRMMTVETDEKGIPIEDQAVLDKIYGEADKAGIDRETYLKAQLDKGRNIYRLREVSDQERQNLKQVTYTDPVTGKTEIRTVVAFNGIFNDENAAAKFVSQNYIAQKGESGNIDKRIYKDMYFVHHPKASNPISELMVAGYEKMFESSLGNLLGMDNSSLQAKGLMEHYGKNNLFIGAHSRGTLTVANALNALDTKENQEKKILSGTLVKMVGPAADVTRSDNRLSRLQTGESRNESNKEGSIRIENHESDPVGSMPLLLGGNPATMNDNEHNHWLGKKILNMFGDDSSVHNCHGLGQEQCVTDGYRRKDDLMMNKEQRIYELNKKIGESK